MSFLKKGGLKDLLKWLSPKSRLRHNKILTFLELFLYLAVYTAMAVSSGIYLWFPGETQDYNTSQRALLTGACNDQYEVYQISSNPDTNGVNYKACTNTFDV